MENSVLVGKRRDGIKKRPIRRSLFVPGQNKDIKNHRDRLPAPLVLFLDLDGTIIGDITHLLAEKEVISSFCPGGVVKEMRSSHISRMRYGLIRPRFDSFLRRVEQCNLSSSKNHLELFIYTASEQSWAIYIIGIIEVALGCKFNRPLFTRNNCRPLDDGTFEKILTPLFPSVVSCLRRKGYDVSVSSLEGRVALIDNTPSVVRTALDRSRLISCPTYNFILAFDVIRLIRTDVLQVKYESIARLLASFGMYPDTGEKESGPPRSCRHFLHVYYSALVTRLKKTTRAENGAEIRDRFWVRLKNALMSPGLPGSLDSQHVKAVERQASQ